MSSLGRSERGSSGLGRCHAVWRSPLVSLRAVWSAHLILLLACMSELATLVSALKGAKQVIDQVSLPASPSPSNQTTDPRRSAQAKLNPTAFVKTSHKLLALQTTHGLGGLERVSVADGASPTVLMRTRG